MTERFDTFIESAEAQGYDIIETTEGQNGYPRNLSKAVIGFADFSEAERFAKDNGGVVVSLCKRDGWQFWKNEGRQYKPFEMEASDYGDDYETTTDAREWWETEKEIAKGLDFDYPEDAQAYFQMLTEIYDKIEELDENEQLLFRRSGECYECEVIPIVTMRYHIDVWTTEIGVVFYE